METDKIIGKLNEMAQLSEDLSAELFDSNNPETSRKFSKIASYCRKICTCVRLHGQIPIEQKNQLRETVKGIDNILKGVRFISNQIPKGQ